MTKICRSKWPEIRRFFSFQKQGNLCAPALQDVSLSDKTLLVYSGQKPSCPGPEIIRVSDYLRTGEGKILATRILMNHQIMKTAQHSDREQVVDILWKAFKNNKSVKYIAGEKEKKIRFLMQYSFENCMDNGKVFLSEDGNACAMIQFMDKKKSFWKSTYLDIQLILKTVGISNIPKVLARESFIKKHYPIEPFTYLWFIGVEPENQGKGSGSKILKSVLDYSKKLNRPVYLETSTERNLPWYKAYGFNIYDVSDRFGFPFYFLKNA